MPYIMYSPKRRSFDRVGDWADAHATGMVGYWLTRDRLACKPGLFGPWTRITLLCAKYDWRWVLELQRYLPPECVAPGNRKIRSPRSGVSLDEILLALDATVLVWSGETPRRDRLRALLDEPDYIIKGMATMAGLRKIVA